MLIAPRVGGHLVGYEGDGFCSGNFEALLVIFVGLQVLDKVSTISFRILICILCFSYGINSDWDEKRV